MHDKLLLASGSEVRAQLLRRAGLEIEVEPARIDEEALRASLSAEGASPRDQADALAEYKARKVTQRHPDRLVLGCDQILSHSGTIMGKPQSPADAVDQLGRLAGSTHSLHSAAVLYHLGEPVWRHVSEARLTMRDLSEGFRQAYVERNWHSVRHCVGAYKLEEEGAVLFTRIDGDYFTVLGMPLLPLLSHLVVRGVIET